MSSFNRPALLLLAMAGIAAAQPALTSIQDILYRADGTRFSGTMKISYSSFQAGDTSNIATANLTLQIVNGVLSVQLAPTTTASAGAQYNVTYSSNGADLFTQVWAVPPSSLPLRLRDILVSTGTVVGPASSTTTIQISDVVGLSNALAVRPTEGAGFAIGRAAVINTSGGIDGAAGNLGDCVRVDGSSGPCGGTSGGVLPLYSDGETPTGTITGVNTTFQLASVPSPAGSLNLYRNGLLMKQGTDYTLSANTISFFLASTPQPGDTLLASYRYANPNNPLGSLAMPQVVCSSPGTSTSAASLTTLGTCTIPAGLLGTGDRIEVQFHFAHTGTATGFTSSVQWAGASILSRAEAGSEAVFTGRLAFSVWTGGQTWDSQSWGGSTTLAAAAGSAAADTTQNLTISFGAQMAGTTTDAIKLENFTVTRYPAQTNP